MKKLVAIILSFIILATMMTACGNNTTTAAAEKTSFSIGCLPLNADTINAIKDYLPAKYKMEVKIFDSNNLPALALTQKDLDGVILNHKPWLDTFNKENNTNLVMVKPYFYHSVFGIYSLKYKNVKDIPQDSSMTIPGDATNMDRGLRIMQAAGLIKLGEKTSNFYSMLDIKENPKNIKFFEVETAASARSITDCAAAISFSSTMKQAGYKPADFLVFEDPDIYSAGLIVQPQDENSGWVKAVVEVFQNKEFRQKFNDDWQGAYVLD